MSYLYTAMALIATLAAVAAAACLSGQPTARLQWLEPYMFVLLIASVGVSYLAFQAGP